LRNAHTSIEEVVECPANFVPVAMIGLEEEELRWHEGRRRYEGQIVIEVIHQLDRHGSQVADLRLRTINASFSREGWHTIWPTKLQLYVVYINHLRYPLPVQPDSTLSALRSANAAVQDGASS
jgi:hypothetical protein